MNKKWNMENAQQKMSFPLGFVCFLFWNIIDMIFLFTICCTAIATQRHEQASSIPEIFLVYARTDPLAASQDALR